MMASLDSIDALQARHSLSYRYKSPLPLTPESPKNLQLKGLLRAPETLASIPPLNKAMCFNLCPEPVKTGFHASGHTAFVIPALALTLLPPGRAGKGPQEEPWYSALRVACA